MAATDEWRWTDDQGVQRVVRTDELRSALASSVLAPSTLVWREGMSEWVPAYTVHELGVSELRPAVADPPTDGTTDVAMPLAARLAAAAHNRDDANDTGRPTPTDILNEAVHGRAAPGDATPGNATPGNAAQASAANGSRTPRPAAGQDAAGVLRIGAAPRPLAVPRAAGKIELPKATRPGGWSAGGPEGGVRAKSQLGKKENEELTLVNDARDPFKLKPAGEGAAAAPAAATPSPANAAAALKGTLRGPGPEGPRRPVTHTAVLPENEQPKPAAARVPLGGIGGAAGVSGRRSPSTIPPAPVPLTRRPLSTPPAKPLIPAAPAAGEARPFRSTALMGSPPRAGAAADPSPSPAATKEAGSPASATAKSSFDPVPSGPSPIGKPGFSQAPFSIVENTSSTGVLPLSGKYAADPGSAQSESASSSFTERTDAFPDGGAPATKASGSSYGAVPPATSPTASASQPYAAVPPASPTASAPQPYAAVPPATSPTASASRPYAAVAPASPTASAPQPYAAVGPQTANLASAPLRPGDMPTEVKRRTPEALGSYPPVPHLVLAAHRALASRPDADGAGASRTPPAGSATASQSGASYAAAPGGYTPPPQSAQMPYSALPPSLSLGEGAGGELRSSGALPLVNPRISQSVPPDNPDNLDISDDGFPRSGGKVGDPVVVPMSSLFGSGAILIAMAISAFFVGRCSAARPVTALPARAALAPLPRLARAALPNPPKPCWMAKQPVRWAPVVLQTVPVDVAPMANGVIVAYARDENNPATVEVDFAAGSFKDTPADKREDKILRVFAPHAGTTPLATTDNDGGPLAPFVFAPSATPFVIGVSGRGTPSPAVAAASMPDATPKTLWPLSAVEKDKGLEAARVLASGPSSYAVVFRRAGSILGGFVGEGFKPEGNLGTVAGSGGAVGKPSLGATKREIAVVFADQKEAGAPWEIRAGHAPLGQIPKETAVVPLPKGGPGGDAFAPDIAGTSDGRWVLVWTEGRSGAFAVRAQTLGADFKALGDPIAISPPAGNFGQAIVGVAGNYVTTMFLSKPKDAKSYELWGAVLQCGP